MKKLFLNQKKITLGSPIFIEGNDYIHLAKSLRITQGEEFLIGNNDGKEFVAVVESITKQAVCLRITSETSRMFERLFHYTLYLPLLKGDRTELILQKCTELGIDEFQPIITERTIVKLDQKIQHKLDRYQNIIREAAMQSGRLTLPRLHSPIKCTTIVEINKKIELGIWGDVSGGSWHNAVNLFSARKKVYCIIGPEGDFTPKEKQLLEYKCFTPINLSGTILRSETACIHATSLIESMRFGGTV